MKRVAALGVLIFALSGLGLAPVSASITGNNFDVTVNSSFGTTFEVCFRFDTPSTGLVSITSLPPITYRHGQLDEVATQFKAVSRTGQGFQIMFKGDNVIDQGLLVGEALNEFGDTFVFSGFRVDTCPLGLSVGSVGISLWEH